jgi:hypothetical protein
LTFEHIRDTVSLSARPESAPDILDRLIRSRTGTAGKCIEISL